MVDKNKIITLTDDNECGFVRFEEDENKDIKLTVFIGEKEISEIYTKATIRKVVKQLDKLSQKDK